METSLPTPMTGRVYVNLLECKRRQRRQQRLTFSKKGSLPVSYPNMGWMCWTLLEVCLAAVSLRSATFLCREGVAGGLHGSWSSDLVVMSERLKIFITYQWPKLWWEKGAMLLGFTWDVFLIFHGIGIPKNTPLETRHDIDHILRPGCLIWTDGLGLTLI